MNCGLSGLCRCGCSLLSAGINSSLFTGASLLTSASGHLTSGVTSSSLFTGSLFTGHTTSNSLFTSSSNSLTTGTSGLLGQLHNRSLLHTTTTTILRSTISIQDERQNYNQQHLHLSLCVCMCVFGLFSTTYVYNFNVLVSLCVRWHGNLIEDLKSNLIGRFISYYTLYYKISIGYTLISNVYNSLLYMYSIMLLSALILSLWWSSW